ncbi:hypothetical protein B0H19DRAFT_1259160 [Mycena capillaripes]|nr:hypothetical protein B0H19DRAFT_1259160 [Mycena capillaripes]
MSTDAVRDFVSSLTTPIHLFDNFILTSLPGSRLVLLIDLYDTVHVIPPPTYNKRGTSFSLGCNRAPLAVAANSGRFHPRRRHHGLEFPVNLARTISRSYLCSSLAFNSREHHPCLHRTPLAQSGWIHLWPRSRTPRAFSPPPRRALNLTVPLAPCVCAHLRSLARQPTPLRIADGNMFCIYVIICLRLRTLHHAPQRMAGKREMKVMAYSTRCITPWCPSRQKPGVRRWCTYGYGVQRTAQAGMYVAGPYAAPAHVERGRALVILSLSGISEEPTSFYVRLKSADAYIPELVERAEAVNYTGACTCVCRARGSVVRRRAWYTLRREVARQQMSKGKVRHFSFSLVVRPLGDALQVVSFPSGTISITLVVVTASQQTFLLDLGVTIFFQLLPGTIPWVHVPSITGSSCRAEAMRLSGANTPQTTQHCIPAESLPWGLQAVFKLLVRYGRAFPAFISASFSFAQLPLF